MLLRHPSVVDFDAELGNAMLDVLYLHTPSATPIVNALLPHLAHPLPERIVLAAISRPAYTLQN
jgi:hypothetical protein